MKLPNRVPLLDSKGYTAEQMREYAAKAVAAEREACWSIIFDYAGRDDLTPEDESLLKHIADLICARGM